MKILLTVILAFFGVYPLTANSETKDKTKKSARELSYFRLPWLSKDYDRWSSSSINRRGLTAKQIKELPDRVDNSSTEAWPGIGNQGKKNCCSQEGTVAGMLTYEFNAIRTKSAAVAENRLPAHFSWHMFNSGQNNGAEMIHGLETAYEIGIPSQKSFGGRYHPTIGYWPSGYEIWHEAMKNRLSGYDFMKVDNPQALQLAKAWLYNHAGWFESSSGGMLAIDGTDVWHAPLKTIPEGQHEAGKKIWVDWGDKYGGHVMCVTGYDDNVGFDINKDGKITNDVDLDNDGRITLADYERGAFIIANSWGTKWADRGKVYVLYRCLMSRREFWDRGPFMGYAVPSKSYQPRLTVRFKAVHSSRNQLRLKFVLTDSSHKTFSWEPRVMYQKKTGSVPLGGPGTEGKDFEWGVDLTRILQAQGRNINSFLSDLQNEKAHVEMIWTEKKSKKSEPTANPEQKTENLLKEAELMIWSSGDELIHSKHLLKRPQTFNKPIHIKTDSE